MGEVIYIKELLEDQKIYQVAKNILKNNHDISAEDAYEMAVVFIEEQRNDEIAVAKAEASITKVLQEIEESSKQTIWNWRDEDEID